MGLVPSLTKYAALAVGLILFGLFVKRSSQVGIGGAASEIGQSIGSFGSGIGSLGGGIKEFGAGVGTGISQLFNPLFTLRELIFPPQAGNQPAPVASTQGQIPQDTPQLTSPPIQTPIEKTISTLNTTVQALQYGNVTSKGVFVNQFTTQDLRFAIDPSGAIKTGSTGLGPRTLAAQAGLSSKYKIPTFDIKGNISQFGGIISNGAPVVKKTAGWY